MLDLTGYQNNFVWWMGVVEDRMDPERLGRCRVRIFGIHPSDKNKVPTQDLPWSHPISPLNSASISGIGETPVGPVEGTHVFGFFRDGENAQYPVMMGTVPGIPQTRPDVGNSEESGFQDPGEKYPKDSEKHGLAESDVTRLARYRWTDWEGSEQKEDKLPPLVQDKLDNRIKSVPVANGLGFFSEPPTKYDAKYPYNHVVVTESGHVYEMDDTPGKERIHEYHSSGTFTEVFPKGTRVQKVVKDNYEFTLGDNYVNIKKIQLDDEGNSHGGNLYVTIEGDVYEFINGNVERQINGSVKETIGGNYSTHVNGDRTINIEGSEVTKIHGDSTSECYNLTEHVIGGQKRYCESEIVLDSPRGVKIQTVGGNINLTALGKPDVTSPTGYINGNITTTATGITEVVSEQSVSLLSNEGSIELGTNRGDIIAVSRNNIDITSASNLRLNSNGESRFVSNLNMYMGTNNDININCLNLNETIDLSYTNFTGNAHNTRCKLFSFTSESDGTLKVSNSLFLNSTSMLCKSSGLSSFSASQINIDSSGATNMKSTGLTSISGQVIKLN